MLIFYLYLLNAKKRGKEKAFNKFVVSEFHQAAKGEIKLIDHKFIAAENTSVVSS